MSYQIYKVAEEYVRINASISELESVEATELIDRLQVERGLSGGFMTGAITESRLKSQREKVDEELSVFLVHSRIPNFRIL